MCGGLFCLVVGLWLLVSARSMSGGGGDLFAGAEIMVGLVGMLFTFVGVVSILMFIASMRPL